MNVDSLADIQTERALLGAILLEEDTATGIDRVARIGVDASIFSDQQTREAWEALSAETAAGRKVDGVILSRLTAIALPQFESWMDLALTRAYAESYANKLVDLANRRVLAGILTQARGWLVDPSQPASFTAMEIENAVARVGLNMDASSRVEVNMSTALAGQIDFWDRAIATGCAGLPTGFALLDGLGGLLPHSLTILSGPRGCCKTTLARQIAAHVAGRLRKPILFISLEQTADQVAGAMAAAHAGVHVALLNAGDNRPALERVKASQAEVGSWPLTLVDRPLLIPAFWAICRRAARKGAALIVLDYLQLLTSDMRADTEERRVASASGACRDIAKTTGVPVLAIASETAGLDGRTRVRHSAQAEYDAWLMARISAGDTGNAFKIEITKNRFGPCPPAVKMQLDRGILRG